MMKQRSIFRHFHIGCLNLVLCTICFAGFCITTKCLYLGGISPYQLNFIVNFLTLCFLGVWLRIKPPPTFQMRELNYYLTQSILMGCMATLWPFAVYFADPANISIFIGLGPLMTGIINWHFGLEDLNVVQYIITTSLAVFGMLLALQPTFIFGKVAKDDYPYEWIGYLIMLGAVFCYSSFACCQRCQKTDELLTLFMRTAFTTIVFGVCSIVVPWASIGIFQWLQIFFLIFLNASALLLLTVGCQNTPATTSSLVFLLEIPFTYIGTAIVFGEVLDISRYAGVALILVSIGQYLIQSGGSVNASVTQFAAFDTPNCTPESSPLLGTRSKQYNTYRHGAGQNNDIESSLAA